MRSPSPAEPLAPEGAAPTWLQRQITFEAGTDVREWHANLLTATRSATADGLLGTWFFVHKPPGSTTHPPGVRLRFRATVPERAAELDQRLEAALVPADSRWTPGVYEPEHFLFGGRSSMSHVHQMFHADSAFWTQAHAEVRDFPDWVLAMAQQRAMLRSLEIVGWEDLGVYGWLRDHAHRRATRPDERIARASAAVRDLWATGDLETLLPDPAIGPFAEWREMFSRSARAWTADYLASDEAVIGARQLAGTLIVFSWNRALVNTRYQCIIASSLSDVAARFGVAG